MNDELRQPEQTENQVTSPWGQEFDEAADASNRVTETEIRDLLDETATIATATPPDLREGLAEERLWILADLAVRGHGLSRQRATRELREAMTDLWDWDGLNIAVLSRLMDILSGIEDDADAPVVLMALRRSAAQALRQARAEDREAAR